MGKNRVPVIVLTSILIVVVTVLVSNYVGGLWLVIPGLFLAFLATVVISRLFTNRRIRLNQVVRDNELARLNAMSQSDRTLFEQIGGPGARRGSGTTRRDLLQ